MAVNFDTIALELQTLIIEPLVYQENPDLLFTATALLQPGKIKRYDTRVYSPTRGVLQLITPGLHPMQGTSVDFARAWNNVTWWLLLNKNEARLVFDIWELDFDDAIAFLGRCDPDIRDRLRRKIVVRLFTSNHISADAITLGLLQRWEIFCASYYLLPKVQLVGHMSIFSTFCFLPIQQQPPLVIPQSQYLYIIGSIPALNGRFVWNPIAYPYAATHTATNSHNTPAPEKKKQTEHKQAYQDRTHTLTMSVDEQITTQLGAMSLRQSDTEAASQGYFRFLDLPRELQEHVIDYAVINESKDLYFLLKKREVEKWIQRTSNPSSPVFGHAYWPLWFEDQYDVGPLIKSAYFRELWESRAWLTCLNHPSATLHVSIVNLDCDAVLHFLRQCTPLARTKLQTPNKFRIQHAIMNTNFRYLRDSRFCVWYRNLLAMRYEQLRQLIAYCEQTGLSPVIKLRFMLVNDNNRTSRKELTLEGTHTSFNRLSFMIQEELRAARI